MRSRGFQSSKFGKFMTCCTVLPFLLFKDAILSTLFSHAINPLNLQKAVCSSSALRPVIGLHVFLFHTRSSRSNGHSERSFRNCGIHCMPQDLGTEMVWIWSPSRTQINKFTILLFQILDDRRKWWWVRNSSGQTGYIPFTILDQNDQSQASIDQLQPHQQRNPNFNSNHQAPSPPPLSPMSPTTFPANDYHQAPAQQVRTTLFCFLLLMLVHSRLFDLLLFIWRLNCIHLLTQILLQKWNSLFQVLYRTAIPSIKKYVSSMSIFGIAMLFVIL